MIILLKMGMIVTLASVIVNKPDIYSMFRIMLILNNITFGKTLISKFLKPFPYLNITRTQHKRKLRPLSLLQSNADPVESNFSAFHFVSCSASRKLFHAKIHDLQSLLHSAVMLPMKNEKLENESFGA